MAWVASPYRWPPDAVSRSPVSHAESAEARNTATRAISSGCLDPAGVDVAQHHVVVAKAAEVAETENLPVQAHRAQEGSARDVVVVVVVDVVDLEAAGAGIAQ